MTTKNSYAAELYGDLLAAGFNIQTAKYVVAQAAHETGNFKSDLFTKWNNPFGMNQPSMRLTTSTGPTPDGFASYGSLFQAALDYRYWWQARNMPETFSDITDFVGTLENKNYFEASLSEYLRGCQDFYKLYYS